MLKPSASSWLSSWSSSQAANPDTMILQDQAHHLKWCFRAVHSLTEHFAFTRTIRGLHCTTVYCRVTVVLHHQRCINPRGRNQMFGHWQQFLLHFTVLTRSSTMSPRPLKRPLQTFCSASAKSLFEVFIRSEPTQVSQTGFRGCDYKTIIAASEVLIYTGDYSFLTAWLQAHLVLVSNSWRYEFSKVTLTIIHCVCQMCVCWLNFAEGNVVSLLL